MIPEALSVRLQEAYGDFFHQIERGYDITRPVTFRINRCKGGEEIAQRLVRQGFSLTPVAWYADAYILHDGDERALAGTEAYERGEIYLQSLSSMLPPLFLEPRAGENILDMTAAPGGKTTQLYALSGGGALITACERDAVRHSRLCYNLQKQGATRVNVIKQDALLLDDALRFDKILLDAPCTGTGTISRGSRIRFSEEYLQRCVRLQRKLIDKALRLLKRGGRLLYSTCSILPEENDAAVKHALERGAKLVPLHLPEAIETLPSAQGTACVCPNELYEGFFLAMFTKM